jgi:RNA polymerase sigma factor (sigma-70 family)
MNYIPDIDLINKIKKESNSEALKELENRHTGIFNQMIKKYYKHLIDFGANPDDIINDKLFVIYKSALNFNPDKNVKFSTWLGNQARYYCLNCINKQTNTISMDNINIKNVIENNQIKYEKDIFVNKENSDLIFSILDRIKDDRISKIFKLRYFNNKKLTAWNKISKKLKISTQTAINLHNKGKILLKNKLTSLNNNDII